MLADFYGMAVAVYPILPMLALIVAVAAIIVNRNGTRRVGLVMIGSMAVMFLAMSANPAWWAEQRLLALAVINAVSSAPLLRHPVTRVQRVIAALFLTSGVLHVLAMWAAHSAHSVTTVWLMSVTIDAAQIAILAGWSSGHIRKAIGDIVRRGRADSLMASVKK